MINPLILAAAATVAAVLNTAPLETLKPGTPPTYIPGSAHIVLGTVILFTIEWDSHGTQRVLTNCRDYDFGLPDFSPEMYTAELDSVMFDLITQACGDIQWI